MRKQNFFRQDLIASVVVFLVAIPLCLGIALASDAPLFSGILGGVVGGIVVGSLSQSSISVTGPAAGMVGIVFTAIHELGSYETFLLALVFSGLLQILIGKLKAGFIADYVPSNVIQGLLCAIGILIIIKQIPLAFGYTSKSSFSLSDLNDHISYGATTICLTSLTLLFSWQKVPIKALRNIPGPVVIVGLGIISNTLFQFTIPFLHLSNKQYLVTIPEIEHLIDVKNLFATPNLAEIGNSKVYFYGFIIALIASIETLLNLEAAEKIDLQKRYCDRNQEMVAQGIGNTISGLIGALPVTSVIVRSSVNMQSGGQTKLSAIMHGLWLMLSVLFIPKVINQIPLASLAAIIIYVGCKLTHINIFKCMYSNGTNSFIPFIITTVMIVCTDVHLGVACGLLASAIFVMQYNSKPHIEKQKEVYPNGEVLRIILPQHTTFLNKAVLITTLRSIPRNTNVMLDASKTLYIDQDIKEVIQDFSNNLKNEKNISLRTKGLLPHYHQSLPEDFTTITTSYTHERLNPNDVLLILKEGNKRFTQNKLLNRDITLHLKHVANSPAKPLAVILGCVDGRVPVEMIFDAAVGELFVTRVLGNVVNDDVIASLEYACETSGAKLIVIIGHTECGAITAACQNTSSHLSQKLNEVINNVTQQSPSLALNKDELIEAVTYKNIQNSKQKILEQSTSISKLINDHKINIIGAIYDVKTGKVNFEELAESQDKFPNLVPKKIKQEHIKEKQEKSKKKI